MGILNYWFKNCILQPNRPPVLVNIANLDCSNASTVVSNASSPVSSPCTPLPVTTTFHMGNEMVWVFNIYPSICSFSTVGPSLYISKIRENLAWHMHFHALPYIKDRFTCKAVKLTQFKKRAIKNLEPNLKILTLLGLGLIKIDTLSANFNNPRPSLILNN